jgi:hypothetical protein
MTNSNRVMPTTSAPTASDQGLLTEVGITPTSA